MKTNENTNNDRDEQDQELLAVLSVVQKYNLKSLRHIKIVFEKEKFESAHQKPIDMLEPKREDIQRSSQIQEVQDSRKKVRKGVSKTEDNIKKSQRPNEKDKAETDIARLQKRRFDESNRFRKRIRIALKVPLREISKIQNVRSQPQNSELPIQLENLQKKSKLSSFFGRLPWSSFSRQVPHSSSSEIMPQAQSAKSPSLNSEPINRSVWSISISSHSENQPRTISNGNIICEEHEEQMTQDQQKQGEEIDLSNNPRLIQHEETQYRPENQIFMNDAFTGYTFDQNLGCFYL